MIKIKNSVIVLLIILSFMLAILILLIILINTQARPSKPNVTKCIEITAGASSREKGQMIVTQKTYLMSSIKLMSTVGAAAVMDQPVGMTRVGLSPSQYQIKIKPVQKNTDIPFLKPQKHSVKESDNLLSSAVQAEAGNQSEHGIRLVTDVILNRVASPLYPDTIEGVIYQPGQFTVAHNGALAKAKANPSAEVKAIVEDEMSRQDRVNTDILYFNNKDNGGWQYGGHWFR